LRDALSDIRRRGAELVIVGNGRPEHAIDFRDSEHVESPLYVDPELRAYAAAGLRRGLRSSLSPGVMLRGVRALIEGQRQGATMGDPWQQGGVFIIRPGNRVDFAYISEEAGDHPSAEAIISALDKVGQKKRAARRRT
jgi:alkyl-hydroperoxide reductase/thiol specific antioxidant family protein